jgi:hypothetical protein
MSGFFSMIRAQINFEAPIDEYEVLEPFTSIPWGTNQIQFLELITKEAKFEINEITENNVKLEYVSSIFLFQFNSKGLYRSYMLFQNSDENIRRDLIRRLTSYYGQPTIDQGAYLWKHNDFGAGILIQGGIFTLNFTNFEVKSTGDNEENY